MIIVLRNTDVRFGVNCLYTPLNIYLLFAKSLTGLTSPQSDEIHFPVVSVWCVTGRLCDVPLKS